jgi:hypothetical protein
MKTIPIDHLSKEETLSRHCQSQKSPAKGVPISIKMDNSVKEEVFNEKNFIEIKEKNIKSPSEH